MSFSVGSFGVGIRQPYRNVLELLGDPENIPFAVEVSLDYVPQVGPPMLVKKVGYQRETMCSIVS